jgi:hypothetical protein
VGDWERFCEAQHTYRKAIVVAKIIVGEDSVLKTSQRYRGCTEFLAKTTHIWAASSFPLETIPSWWRSLWDT